MKFKGIKQSKSKRYLYQVPDWLGFYAARPREHQYANLPMLTFLAELTLNWNGWPIGLGDISLENATAPPTHHTHIHGSCVDLYIFHKQNLQRSGHNTNAVTMRDDKETKYDQARTIKLAKTIRQVVERCGFKVVQFLYDDPAVKSVWHKITQSRARPHHDHFHIQLHEDYDQKGQEKPSLRQAMLQQKYGF